MDEVHQVIELCLPKSSISDVSGAKDVPNFGKTIRKSTSLQEGLISMKEELRAKATSTSVNAVGISIMARSRIFLRRKEVMKLFLINSRTDAIKRLLIIAKYLHAGDASGLPGVLGNWFPGTHTLFFQSHLHSPKGGVLHL